MLPFNIAVNHQKRLTSPIPSSAKRNSDKDHTPARQQQQQQQHHSATQPICLTRPFHIAKRQIFPSFAGCILLRSAPPDSKPPTASITFTCLTHHLYPCPKEQGL
ncbi:hypothetical protein HDV57DRAFT_207512 [Trichoderma longibrachiatum]